VVAVALAVAAHSVTVAKHSVAYVLQDVAVEVDETGSYLLTDVHNSLSTELFKVQLITLIIVC
jgi:hypothetical protein